MGGRALWEHNTGDYGTTMALMLLPYWTDSCIGSMEGLFFEASATTPYHFLTSAAMSDKASNPVRGLTYTNQDAALGTRYLQELGVRYYLAYTPAAVARADVQPDLIPVATSGPWHVYEVVGSDLVVPLTTEPVVVDERSGDQRERWLEVGASWFQRPELWTTLPASDGPDSWQRVAVTTDEAKPHPAVDLVQPVQTVTPVEASPAVVTNVKQSDESISFDVDQVGVPVLVRISYYPNWKAEGADGPYRVAPNFMVVVPTSTHVRLVYESSPIELGANAVSILGLFGLMLLWWRGPIDMGPGDWWEPYPTEPDPFEPEGPNVAFGPFGSPPTDPDSSPPPPIPPFDQEAGWSLPSAPLVYDIDDIGLPADPTEMARPDVEPFEELDEPTDSSEPPVPPEGVLDRGTDETPFPSDDPPRLTD